MAINQSYDEWKFQSLGGGRLSAQAKAEIAKKEAQQHRQYVQKIRSIQQAHVIAYKKHRAYGHLPQREKMSLADALKTIQFKIQAA